MWVLLLSGTLFGVCFLGYKKSEWGSDREVVFVLAVIFSGLVFLISLVSVPVMRMEYNAEYHKYHATVETIEAARAKNDNWHENVSLTKDVIEMNNWLASAKYYHSIFGSLYVPKKILELERIE